MPSDSPLVGRVASASRARRLSVVTRFRGLTVSGPDRLRTGPADSRIRFLPGLLAPRAEVSHRAWPGRLALAGKLPPCGPRARVSGRAAALRLLGAPRQKARSNQA